MAEITERNEVTVRSEEATFVLVAEPQEGRLVIREERDGGEVCALTLADPEELRGFFEGLRRVLGRTREGGPESAGAPPVLPAGGGGSRRPATPGAQTARGVGRQADGARRRGR